MIYTPGKVKVSYRNDTNLLAGSSHNSLTTESKIYCTPAFCMELRSATTNNH
jgi:hypothetical protein